MKRKTMLEMVNEYIRYKNDLGFDYSSKVFALRSFAKFADEYAFGKPLTISLALRWATLSKAGHKRHIARVDILRPLAEYLCIIDPRTELIPRKILGPRYPRPEPYIYSNTEIIRLMGTEAYIPKRKRCNNTFSTIIGLLACSGMRIGEVLSLRRRDIDWNQKTIVVRNSKNLPMRLVPLDPSTMIQLLLFSRRWHGKQTKMGDEPFFISLDEGFIPYDNFLRAWQRVLVKIDMAKKHHGKNPRMHDLRHTFACNQLLRAYKEKRNIDTTISMLSVYLGHQSVEKTYWYLTGIPALLELSGKRFEEYIKNQRKKSKSS